MMDRYKIVRMYWDTDHPDHLKTIKRGLSLEDAQAHCQREDTHEQTENGQTVWFDGYTNESRGN
jgi:hypothetical protein